MRHPFGSLYGLFGIFSLSAILFPLLIEVDETRWNVLTHLRVGNRGLSGIVYRIKVECVCSKQSRRNAWGAGFGKIADAEFHARKIKWQPPISNGRNSQHSRRPWIRRLCLGVGPKTGKEENFTPFPRVSVKRCWTRPRKHICPAQMCSSGLLWLCALTDSLHRAGQSNSNRAGPASLAARSFITDYRGCGGQSRAVTVVGNNHRPSAAARRMLCRSGAAVGLM